MINTWNIASVVIRLSNALKKGYLSKKRRTQRAYTSFTVQHSKKPNYEIWNGKWFGTFHLL